MLVAVAIENWNLAVERGAGECEINVQIRRIAHGAGRSFERTQRAAHITVAGASKVRARVVIDGEPVDAHAIDMGDRAAQGLRNIGLIERLKLEHHRARQQRGRDGPSGILRCCAEQHHASRLDAFEQRILLIAGKTVDFVDEQQRAPR